jgi:peroxiredoxin
MPGVLTLIDADGHLHDLPAEGSAVDAAALQAATGWALKPEGLCRGERCVPLLGRAVERPDGRIDLEGWAEALGIHLALDLDEEVAAFTEPADERAAALAGGQAPELDLEDVDGNLHRFSDLAGRKRVLVTWASWCGCRHEIGAWQALQEELEPAGVSIFSVALDASPESARPWIEAASPTFPVVVDTAHVTAERYGITNVPSVVWVDEEGRIVKPPTIAPGDDQFRDFTGIDSVDHHDALRRWAATGELPDSAAHPPPPRTAEQQLALAERRIAAVLLDRGRTEAATTHLERAKALAPWDWTVRRGGIALTGGDPFLGDEFLAFWEDWDSQGRPGYEPT